MSEVPDKTSDTEWHRHEVQPVEVVYRQDIEKGLNGEVFRNTGDVEIRIEQRLIRTSLTEMINQNKRIIELLEEITNV